MAQCLWCNKSKKQGDAGPWAECVTDEPRIGVSDGENVGYREAPAYENSDAIDDKWKSSSF